MSKPTFVVSCPIDCYSGYSSRSRDFVKALIELDQYDVKIIPQRWGSTPWGFIEDHKKDWGFLNEHIVSSQITEQPDIWCQISVPNEFRPIGKWNLGLTAGIETTACAHSWIEGINRMDLTLVSSTHSKEIFVKTKYDKKDSKTNQSLGEDGVTKPIEVLIEGANLDTYKIIDYKDFNSKTLYKDLNAIPESFAFLSVGHWMQGNIGEDRKNIGLLVKAFYEIFKNKTKKPALILKISSGGSSYIDRRKIQEKIEAIKKSVPSKNIPNIYILHGEFTDDEMNEIYNHPKIKSMVSLTKGEGFGRPLLEFSLTDKPVVTTGWSGHTDFLNPDFSALMGGTLTPIHSSAQVKDMLIADSKWFTVDSNHVGFFMTDIFENYKKWKEKAKKQGNISRSNFSFDKMKEQLKDILDKNVPDFPKKVDLVLPPQKLLLPKLKKI